jgi:hypothetical protein
MEFESRFLFHKSLTLLSGFFDRSDRGCAAFALTGPAATGRAPILPPHLAEPAAAPGDVRFALKPFCDKLRLWRRGSPSMFIIVTRSRSVGGRCSRSNGPREADRM